MLPYAVQKYYWDVPLESIDLNAHRRYVITRLLELGDEVAIAWLLCQYSGTEIKSVIETSRELSPKSRNYWRLKLSAK